MLITEPRQYTAASVPLSQDAPFVCFDGDLGPDGVAVTNAADKSQSQPGITVASLVVLATS